MGHRFQDRLALVQTDSPDKEVGPFYTTRAIVAMGLSTSLFDLAEWTVIVPSETAEAE